MCQIGNHSHGFCKYIKARILQNVICLKLREFLLKQVIIQSNITYILHLRKIAVRISLRVK